MNVPAAKSVLTKGEPFKGIIAFVIPEGVPLPPLKNNHFAPLSSNTILSSIFVLSDGVDAPALELIQLQPPFQAPPFHTIFLANKLSLLGIP